MQSRVPLDYAVFQLSPRRSRCDLIVSYDGTMERLASGLVKPFVTHLKVAEEQVASAGKSIKLNVERFNNATTWFTKGTLERFVRFVSTPEVLETVNTFDAEMSQLESARKIYSQGMAGNEFSTSGEVGNGVAATSDATKKELLRAIDVRLSAVKQDLMTACSHASAAGFNPETVKELHLFADHFGAPRLKEACTKYITVTQRRADLFNFDNTISAWNSSSDSVLRSSIGSDMSLDDTLSDQPKPATSITTKVAISPKQFSREPSPSLIKNPNEIESTNGKKIDKDNDLGDATFGTESTSISTGKPQLTRRLSVQERISLFENKTQNFPAATTPTSTVAKPDLRRLPSEVNLSTDKAVLRRWSGASDTSIDVSGDRKEPDSHANTPIPSASSLRTLLPPISKDLTDPKSEEEEKNSKLPVKAKFGSQSAVSSDGESESNSKIPSFSGRSTKKDQSTAGFRSGVASLGRSEEFEFENQSTLFQNQIKYSPKNIEQFGSPNQITAEKLKNLSGDDGEKQEETGNSSEVEAGSVPAQGRDSKSLATRTESHSMPVEASGLFRGKFQGNGSGHDQLTKHGGKEESASKVGGGPMNLTGKAMIKNQDAFSSVPMDQVQRVRQPNVNQGVNDELKLKANELEKLFAEHKLRVPADQPNSARRVRPVEMASQDAAAAELSTMKSESETPAGSSDYDVTPKRNIYSSSFSDDSRGKSYQKYMQKRDAKLKEDWSSNRSEKEAKLKAMQDSLDEGRAEMKVKLASSAEKRNSACDTQRRAQNTRSFNVRPTIKRGQPTETFVSDEDEGHAELLRSRSGQSKRVQPSKNASSPATRNPPASNPRSSVKAINVASGRRRLPYDTPLAQSVPNFSDLKKENMKPLSTGSKPVRPQGRTHARKKSTIEDLSLGNEEKPRRFQSSRKNMGSTTELNNSRNSDDVDDVMASKYHSEENDGYEEISTDTKSKALSRKGSGSRRGACSDMGISKGFGDTSFDTEELIDVAKHEELGYETTVVKEPTYVENSKGRLSHESDKSGNSGFENNNALRFVSQAGSVSAVESPNSVPSLFRSMGSTLDSPGESPGDWNPRLQNPFAFSHEISDMDASDSPNGSPASWNFDAEAAKMRKKWGAAQIPIVGIESPHSQSRKDVSRGLKRFLKFGRKNRASDSLADWISITTSEGDDSEDGRDLANRSSEDLRKSRMGFLQSHNSDEGFNESELIEEQVHALESSIRTSSNSKTREKHMSGSSLKAPKSFFSLANFRTKSNDAKPR